MRRTILGRGRTIICVMLIAFISMFGLAGCGGSQKEPAAKDGNIQIVTTIFPSYDWTMNVLGDNPGDVEVTMLLEKGTDLHNYQPTVEDILKISTCDLFIYVGGESDKWVDGVLKEASNKDMKVINLLEALGDGAKEEEMVEGMQEADHDHEEEEVDHDHEENHDEEADHEDGEDEEDHHHGEESEYDEHIWLSLRNAATLTEIIEGEIEAINPENSSAYKENLKAYIGQLEALDKEYKDAVDKANNKTLLFGDRFPFRYLTDDYGISYYAAFVGCSAETEASFETITFLAQKTDELKLKSVMTIEGGSTKIAETIIQNTESKNQKILSLDSMQSTTGKDVEEGKTYLSIMESNLEVLKEALQ